MVNQERANVIRNYVTDYEREVINHGLNEYKLFGEISMDTRRHLKNTVSELFFRISKDGDKYPDKWQQIEIAITDSRERINDYLNDMVHGHVAPFADGRSADIVIGVSRTIIFATGGSESDLLPEEIELIKGLDEVESLPEEIGEDWSGSEE